MTLTSIPKDSSSGKLKLPTSPLEWISLVLHWIIMNEQNLDFSLF